MAWDGKPRITPLSGLLAMEPWREFAACVNHPRVAPTAFDDAAIGEGREDEKEREKRIAPAKAVCRTECTVRAECLRDVDLEVDSGVRGGVDLRPLVESRKSRTPLSPGDPRHGTTNGYGNHKCRCEKCRDAINEYHRKRRGEKAS